MFKKNVLVMLLFGSALYLEASSIQDPVSGARLTTRVDGSLEVVGDQPVLMASAFHIDRAGRDGNLTHRRTLELSDSETIPLVVGQPIPDGVYRFDGPDVYDASLEAYDGTNLKVRVEYESWDPKTLHGSAIVSGALLGACIGGASVYGAAISRDKMTPAEKQKTLETGLCIGGVMGAFIGFVGGAAFRQLGSAIVDTMSVSVSKKLPNGVTVDGSNQYLLVKTKRDMRSGRIEYEYQGRVPRNSDRAE